MQPPPTGLPIEEVVDHVAGALTEHRVAVVTAPPGTGKTTVLPLRLLAQPWLANQPRIVVLEPRRIATRAAAHRMAALLGQEVGATVGFVTRDQRATSPATRVEVVTEGVLTRRLQRDPTLPGTGLVVFDEIHERNLQTDLGLALAIESRSVFRPDLRLMAMSATIDSTAIAQLLGGENPAPVIDVSGIQHPVDIKWRPPARGGGRSGRSRRIADHTARVVREAITTAAGDVLVFLPGIREIDETAALLVDIPAQVHRLHGSLTLEEQDTAIQPAAFPKVVLSTDIAESSLTVEGVRVVVDAGLARAPRFDAGTGMTRLRTVSISRASADQRAGRAGRLGPGVCFRLWSKIEHGARRPDIEPEIVQADLAGFSLEAAAWGVRDPSRLPLLDPPPARTLTEAHSLLVRLGLVDERNAITDRGRRAVHLPVHPRLAAMMLAAPAADAGLAALVAALIEERDPVTGPFSERPADLGLRIEAITGRSRSVRLDRRRTDRIERTAADLVRRAGLPSHSIEASHAGPVLALAFPDRLATRRGSRGRFQLRGGTTAWLPETDELAAEAFIVVAETDGKRKDARIRSAAAIDREDVLRVFSEDVDRTSELRWRGERLVQVDAATIGGVVLTETEIGASPSADTLSLVLRRLASDGLHRLPWSPAATSIRTRVQYLRATVGDPWPDFSDDALRKSTEVWLAPFVGDVTALDQLAGLDMAMVLRSTLGPLSSRLEQEAPTRIELPSGRSARVEYRDRGPVIRARAQHLFGVRTTPRIGGKAVTMEILSPADRPIQTTSDLENFWTGSWKEVRRDMAARYPKHDWPEDP